MGSKIKHLPTVWLFVALLFLAGGGLLVWLFTGNDDYTPKPRGYFRITLPEKNYRTLDSVYPYSFQYPAYAQLSNDPLSPQEKYWMNINLPTLRGRIHLSYKPINNQDDLGVYSEDARTMAFNHMQKSSGISQISINDPKRKVYGMVYSIKGLGAASPCQFFLTDSARHFLRGSLYFDATPNNDSLAPVITFVEADIQRFIETLRWK